MGIKTRQTTDGAQWLLRHVRGIACSSKMTIGRQAAKITPTTTQKTSSSFSFLFFFFFLFVPYCVLR